MSGLIRLPLEGCLVVLDGFSFIAGGGRTIEIVLTPELARELARTLDEAAGGEGA